jgi:hypothetical protein
MSVAELIGAVTPPAEPIDATDAGLWDALEARLGIRLPSDWRDFGLAYGSGEFGMSGGFTFWNPFAADTLRWIQMVLKVLRGNKEAWPEYGVPFDLHPTTPGLLPWGVDVNGCTYCWLTSGQPEEWPVIFLAHESEDRPEKYEMSMTSFVKKLVNGELQTVTRGELANAFTPGRNQSEVAARLVTKRDRG